MQQVQELKYAQSILEHCEGPLTLSGGESVKEIT